MFNEQQVAAAVADLIAGIGEDPGREGLLETPRRIADFYREAFAGLDMDPKAELTVTFQEDHKEMVILRDAPFYSMCEHHFLPFYGVAHVSYVPNGRVVGLSKLVRVVEILARRPQVQERLTSQIADTIVDGLAPLGVAVVIAAEHLCMSMRGINKPGTTVITSATRGVFRRNAATRAEFLELIRGTSA